MAVADEHRASWRRAALRRYTFAQPPGADQGRRAREVTNCVAGILPNDTCPNSMSQYRALYRAVDYPEISGRLIQASNTSSLRAASLCCSRN